MLWYQAHEFIEDLCVMSPRAKELREIAREYDMPIPDVEDIQKHFDRFDEDRSGHIDREEFTQLLCTLLRVKDPSDLPPDRIHRYWMQIDLDHSGEVSFREFVPWYATYFYVPKGTAADEAVSPMTAYYASFGTGRFKRHHHH